MSSGLRILRYLGLLLIPVVGFGQVHHNIWLRTTAQVNLHLRWRLGLELQHRRQDMVGGSNPLAYDLMYSVRPWLYYQYQKSLRVEIAPVSVFRLSNPVNARSDIERAPQMEYRSSLALQFTQPFKQHFSLILRPAMEYRMLSRHVNLFRLRAKFQIQRALSAHLNLFAYEELMLHVAGVSPAHVLDQNRLGLGLQWNPTPRISFEAGYVYLSRLPIAGDELLADHNFFLQCYWRLK